VRRRKAALDLPFSGVLILFYWIYDLPSWLATCLFIIFFVGVNSLGVYFIRPLIRPLVADLSDENNLFGNVLSLYSVMFGLLMGTLAVVTYQNLADSQKLVDTEATSIAALYRIAQSYPDREKAALSMTIREYTTFVIDEAWPLQKRGIVPSGGVTRADKIQQVLFDFEPQTPRQQILHQQALQQYANFIVARRARLGAVLNAIPSILWWTMASGSLVLMSLMWLFDASRVSLLVLSGIAAFALGSMIGLIALMDNPFRGELSVSSDPYRLVLEQLMSKK
jgi:hypothetical protein